MSCACLICIHPSSSNFGGWPRQFFFEVGHIPIFLELGAQISDGRQIWVGEGGLSFIHDGWLVAVTVCLSKVLLQIIHCSGVFVGCSCSKVKSISFQVSAPAMEVSLGFELWAWFISRFLAFVILGLGGFPLVPVSRDLRFNTLR